MFYNCFIFYLFVVCFKWQEVIGTHKYGMTKNRRKQPLSFAQCLSPKNWEMWLMDRSYPLFAAYLSMFGTFSYHVTRNPWCIFCRFCLLIYYRRQHFFLYLQGTDMDGQTLSVDGGIIFTGMKSFNTAVQTCSVAFYKLSI